MLTAELHGEAVSAIPTVLRGAEDFLPHRTWPGKQFPSVEQPESQREVTNVVTCRRPGFREPQHDGIRGCDGTCGRTQFGRLQARSVPNSYFLAGAGGEGPGEELNQLVAYVPRVA